MAIWKGLIIVVAVLAMRILPWQTKFTAAVTDAGERLPYFFSMWANFDGVHYLVIALKGYEPLTQPFFPLFPLLVAIFSHLTSLHVLYSSLILNHLFLLFALIITWLLLKQDGIKNPIVGIALLLAYPTSFYFGAAYNDALFFLCASSCILAARRKVWLLAGVCGGLATLTRLNGLALFPFLALEFLVSQLDTPKSWRTSAVLKTLRQKLQLSSLFKSGIVSAVYIPAAFGLYLVYLQLRFGDWRSLFTTMAIWDQSKTTFPLVVVWRYLKIFWYHTP